MKTLKVSAVGHGTGWNRYPVVFDVIVDPQDSEEAIFLKVKRKAINLTACDSVTIESIEEKKP